MTDSCWGAPVALAAVPQGFALSRHIHVLKRRQFVSLFAGAATMGGVSITGMGVLPWGTWLGLLGLGLVSLGLRAWAWRGTPRDVDVHPKLARAWLRRFDVINVLCYAWLGGTGWVCLSALEGWRAGALVLMVSVYVMNATQWMAMRPGMSVLAVVVGGLPIVVHLALVDQAAFHLEASGLVLLMYGSALITVPRQRAALLALLLQEWRTTELTDQLRTEKAAAVVAHREAERSNRAKTQFLAAASHDLRQPMHALSLFAGALRDCSRDVAVQHLVNCVDNSVGALQSLFSELMDISRIDAGGVEVRPQHFSMDSVFNRLRLQFEPVAFDRGLYLAFWGGQHHAFADPILIERVLQNLLSNAIRYTEDGGVLVSARRRRDRLCLQVWDTGVGIAEAECEQVFEEFYQVDRGRALEPAQRKGLGLGLAIVKRLLGLMGAEVSLRSRVGQGSVFTVLLPLGWAGAQAVTACVASPVALNVMADRLVIVVEDDRRVRGAVELLLTGWGARVLAYENLEALDAWMQAHPLQASSRPDLLMLDYRLANGRTGLEAIEPLRRYAGYAVPTVVITGSTMSDLSQEAKRQDFHVLTKPVVPAKLRAMLTFKLGGGMPIKGLEQLT